MGLVLFEAFVEELRPSVLQVGHVGEGGLSVEMEVDNREGLVGVHVLGPVD